MRVNGKMEDDMVWVLKPEAVGFIEVNGLADQRGDMEYGKVLLQQQSMKEPGRVVFKMDMVQKRTLMEVRDFICYECFIRLV